MDPGGAALVPGTVSDERDSGVRTVLFTDIVNSTELMERLGDSAGMALVEIHDITVREALKATGGREIKHTGDGIMAAFVSAVAAVRCATQIQRALAEHPVRNGDAPLFVRIGAAAGEPVEANHDFFGSTVNLAARLCAHAEPEQSLVSNVITELCLGKGFTFHDLGEIVLKGFEHRFAFTP